MRTYLYVSAATLLVAGLGTGSAMAQLGVDLGIVDAEVDVNADDGIEADADVNLLGDDGVDADADVALGGDSAADTDVDVNIGGDGGANASVDAEVGGGDNLADVDADVNIGGERDEDGNGGAGGDDDSGTGGDDDGGETGVDGMPNPNQLSVGGGAATGTDGITVSCIDSGSSIYAQLANISYSSSAVANWANANSVTFVPVSICPGENAGFVSGLLAQAAASMPMLQSALAQSSYASSDIVGIVQQGGQLTVYID